jgi:hypothetical protein
LRRLPILILAVLCLAPVAVAADVGAAQPPPPPLDSDGDGVPDDVDDCPGRHGKTPSGCPDAYPPDDTDPVLRGEPRTWLGASRLRMILGRFSEDVRGSVKVTSGQLELSKRFRARGGRGARVSFRLTRAQLSALRERERVRLRARVTATDFAGHSSAKTLRLTLRP